MIFLYILVGSITVATRLKKLIERVVGYPADVVHTPEGLNKGGCSYSVRADDRLKSMIIPFSEEYSIPIKKIYTMEIVDGERVYHVVS